MKRIRRPISIVFLLCFRNKKKELPQSRAIKWPCWTRIAGSFSIGKSSKKKKEVSQLSSTLVLISAYKNGNVPNVPKENCGIVSKKIGLLSSPKGCRAVKQKWCQSKIERKEEKFFIANLDQQSMVIDFTDLLYNVFISLSLS